MTDCECKDKDCDCEDLSMEEIVYSNDALLNTLVEMLIDKKVISEKDLLKKLEDLEKEE
ncbi:hypothetical protein HN789_07275 [archaeon]|jgi:hypothetical protein|nr:hypothetical protein [archaeon]MBT4021781.1 hypothetical protein [archaeon]MBT4271804.1 hypothetical protein [archaeon]MBT4460501.1 hypothetical protein [archaeon]MBT4858521.1 hypothetical protein [archaeon]